MGTKNSDKFINFISKKLGFLRVNILSRYIFDKLGSFKSFDLFLNDLLVGNKKKIRPQKEGESNADYLMNTYYIYFIMYYKKFYIINDFFYFIFDLFYFYFNYYIFNRFFSISLYKNNVINLKLLQTKNNFIYKFYNKDYNQFLLLSNYGLKSIWKGIRYWLFSILVALIIVYYCLAVRLLPFAKIIFQWFLVTMFFYWLISGFVWFFKKYQYRYFTGSIQRFWRRSFIIFWAIEGFLFLIFVYLTLNANQEPVFMYDNSQVYKTHLFSWRYFLIKIFPSTLLIIFSYFILLSLKWNTFSKSNFLVLLVTIILLYIMWQEFYQFFHIMSFYGNLNWVYDSEDHLWNLEVEFRRTRIVNHYVTIALVAKFWHLVFVLVFWVFFVLRCLEVSRIRYPLFSANFQNFIIVYMMSWVYMYPWFKYIFKKFFELPYFWFYVNTRRLGLFIFFNDFKLFLLSIFDFFFDFFSIFNNTYLYYFNNFDFFYWHNSSDIVGYSQYRKNYIRDHFIKNIYN